MASGDGLALLTYTPDTGEAGTQRNRSKAHAFDGGCCRSDMVFPIIAVVARAAGTMVAQLAIEPPVYSARRLNCSAKVPGSESSGWHCVQLKSGVSAMDNGTGLSVDTPER